MGNSYTHGNVWDHELQAWVSRGSFDWKVGFWQRFLFLLGCPITVEYKQVSGSTMALRLAGALLTLKNAPEPKP